MGALLAGGCASGSKSGDTGSGSVGAGVGDDGDEGGDTGICSLATDPDRDGYCADDCAPEDPAVHPGARESCNGSDDDCDGEIDEDAGVVWYLDLDQDGWGGEAVTQCDPPEHYADNGADCDDANASVHPGADERADGLDNDCDELIDEGVGGGDDPVAITADWDRDGVLVSIENGTAAVYDFGMAETGSGADGWYGETCISGEEPGGVDDYGYDICHSLGPTGGEVESVYPDLADVDDGTTLFYQGLSGGLTYFVADAASADCWVWGDDVGHYLAFGCVEL